MKTMKLWIETDKNADDGPTITILQSAYARLPERHASDRDRVIRVKNLDTGKWCVFAAQTAGWIVIAHLSSRSATAT